MEKIVGVVNGRMRSRAVSKTAIREIISNSLIRARAQGKLNAFLIGMEMSEGHKRYYIPIKTLRKYVLIYL